MYPLNGNRVRCSLHSIRMKFVALVSGGKDSAYALELCQSLGHELVCLANLYPPEKGPDDLNSWMYQTVGHQVNYLK